MKNVHCFELPVIYNAVILDGCLWNLKDWISVKDVIKFYLQKFKMKAKGYISSYCPVFFNMITTKKTNWC